MTKPTRPKKSRKNNSSTLLKFPCDFPIKVFGKATAAFETEVAVIIRKHFPDIGEAAISTHPSKGNNYIAVSAIVRAKSKKQLDDLYCDLSACDKVIMAL